MSIRKITKYRITSFWRGDTHINQLTLKTDWERDIVIQGSHYRDCCERVGFAFEEIANLSELEGLEFVDINFSLPKKGGLLIRFTLPTSNELLNEIFEDVEPDQKSFFVSAYNYQNGYYSDNLECIVKDGKDQIFYSENIKKDDKHIG